MDSGVTDMESCGAKTFRLDSRESFWTGAFWVLNAKEMSLPLHEHSKRSAAEEAHILIKFIFEI
jgi:hypothetical protein